MDMVGAFIRFTESSMSYATRQLLALALGIGFIAALGACGPASFLG